MSKDEALKMAIEWVEGWKGIAPSKIELLRVLREALEQQDENDQHWYNEGYGQGKFDALMDAELAQEPVAYMQASEINYIKAMKEEGIKEWRTCLGMNHEAGDVALYTHPAPSWQGLSADEIEQAILSKNKAGEWWGMCLDIARAIEQALRNKNART